MNGVFTKEGKCAFDGSCLDERLLIVGLGNPLMGDDGAGIEVVNMLRDLSLPEFVDVIDGGTPGVGLIDLMSGYGRVILVDAVVGQRHPEPCVELGSALFAASPGNVRDGMGDDHCSLHETELTSVMKLMQTLGMKIPEITLAGIPAFNIAPGIGLSNDCMRLIPQAVKLITETLNRDSDYFNK